MDVDEGWQVKSNKRKGTSSPLTFIKPHRIVIHGVILI